MTKTTKKTEKLWPSEKGENKPGKSPWTNLPEEPSLAGSLEDLGAHRVVKDSKLFKGYPLPMLHFPDREYFKTSDERTFQDRIRKVMTWQSIGLGLLEEVHDQALNFTKVQRLQEENESLKSRVADLEKKDADFQKKSEELQMESAAEFSRLETERADLKKKLDEAEGNVASFKESAKKAESDHLEALAKLRAEKVEAINECTVIRDQKRAGDQKYYELTMANTKLQEDLDFHTQRAAELTQDAKEMADELNEAVYDAFCNYIKQVQPVNPGLAFNLQGISPEFAFNADGVLVCITTGEVVSMKDSRQIVFDPDRPYAQFQGEDEMENDGAGATMDDGGTSKVTGDVPGPVA